MKEEWRPCKDYEGLYEVSNYGRVRSCDKMVSGGHGRYYFKKGEIKKLTNRKDGYVTVCLYKDNKQKHVRVHRLVAYAFIENDDFDNKNHVNHIDCNRSNNNVNNLEWCSIIENHIHSDNLGRKTKPPIMYGRDNKHSIPVIATKLDTNEEFSFISITEALEFIGVENVKTKVGNVMRAIKNDWSAYGYKWRYSQDTN